MFGRCFKTLVVPTAAFCLLVSASGLGFSQNAKVNINKATVQELEQVKGIGPKVAQEIISLREKKGSFTSVDDLMEVRMIGPKKLDQIKDQLTLE